MDGHRIGLILQEQRIAEGIAEGVAAIVHGIHLFFGVVQFYRLHLLFTEGVLLLGATLHYRDFHIVAQLVHELGSVLVNLLGAVFFQRIGLKGFLRGKAGIDHGQVVGEEGQVVIACLVARRVVGEADALHLVVQRWQQG